MQTPPTRLQGNDLSKQVKYSSEVKKNNKIHHEQFCKPFDKTTNFPNNIQNQIPLLDANKQNPYSHIQNLYPQIKEENWQTKIISGKVNQFPQLNAQRNPEPDITGYSNDIRYRQFYLNNHNNVNQQIVSNQIQKYQNTKYINQNQKLFDKNKNTKINDDTNIKAPNRFKNNMLNIDINNNEILKRSRTPNRPQSNIYSFPEMNPGQDHNTIRKTTTNNLISNKYQKKYPSIVIHNTHKQIFTIKKGMNYDQLFEMAFGPNYIPKKTSPKNKTYEVMIISLNHFHNLL